MLTVRFHKWFAVWDSTGAKLLEQVVTNQHNQPSGITAMLVTSDGQMPTLEQFHSGLILTLSCEQVVNAPCS